MIVSAKSGNKTEGTDYVLSTTFVMSFIVVNAGHDYFKYSLHTLWLNVLSFIISDKRISDTFFMITFYLLLMVDIQSSSPLLDLTHI